MSCGILIKGFVITILAGALSAGGMWLYKDRQTQALKTEVSEIHRMYAEERAAAANAAHLSLREEVEQIRLATTTLSSSLNQWSLKTEKISRGLEKYSVNPDCSLSADGVHNINSLIREAGATTAGHGFEPALPGPESIEEWESHRPW